MNLSIVIINEEHEEVDKINTEEFLEELINQYGNLVFSICYKITKNYFDAEDLAQDTFLSAYKHMDSFDGSNPKAWLSRIATNKCLDYLKRAAAKTLPTAEEHLNMVPSANQTPEELYLDQEVKQKLLVLCKSLKPPYDEISTYYFYMNLTVNEIAQKTGKNKKTVQTQIYRSKGLLKSLWRKEYQ